MRMAIAVCVFALVACSPPSHPEAMPDPSPETANTGSSGASRAAAPAFALETDAIVGRWSFDRSCGLYDLVFNADASANYYDYTDEQHVVSYAGRWTSDHNRVVMSLHRLGETGGPIGDALSYTLDVSDPVADDLIGQFGPAGSDMRAISAKRCPEEDRQ